MIQQTNSDNKRTQYEDENMRIAFDVPSDDNQQKVDEISGKYKVLKKINSINIWLERTLKGTFDFLIHTAAGRISIMMIIFLFVTVPIVLISLGFDNYFLRSSLTGSIYSENQELLSNVTIEIQEEVVTTDDKGRYEFDDLDYGRWEVTISANGYLELKQDIVLERFSNEKDFKLIPLDFGEADGKLLTEGEFNDNNLEFKINDQLISVDQLGNFETGRLITGEYTLSLSSPFYKDFEKTIELKSGKHSLEDIELEPAGDISGNVVDFLTEGPIDDFELDLAGEIEIDMNENTFFLTDLDVETEIELIVSRENYKEQKIELLVSQGKNEIDDIKLVREGKLYGYYGDSIVYSDYDGENFEFVTERLNNILFDSFVGDGFNFFSDDDLYYTRTGSSPTLLYSGIRDTLSRPISNGGYIEVGVTDLGTNIIRYTKGEEEKILFETTTESIISWVVDDNSEFIFFSTTSGVYKSRLISEDDAEKITEGVFFLRDINTQKTLVALNFSASSQQSNIWIIQDDGSRERISQFSSIFISTKFINDQTLLYVKSNGSVNNLYKRVLGSNSEQKLATDIINFIHNPGNNFITVAKSDKYYLVDIEGEVFQMSYR